MIHMYFNLQTNYQQNLPLARTLEQGYFTHVGKFYP